MRDPQALVATPQKSGVGRVGRAQQVPAPAPPEVVHARPLPQEVDEHVRDPQALDMVVLQPTPSPPQVGSAQQVPAWGGLGWLHCWFVEQPQVCVPPQPSDTLPQPEPHAVFVQQVPALPTADSEQVPFEPQPQSMMPPQPSGRSLPHLPGKPVAHVFGTQQVPVAEQVPLSAQAFVIFPPQPSSNTPHATLAAAGGRTGTQGLPHLPLALQTSPVSHLPQLMVAPPQRLLMLPHSRP